jgi:transmembrane sensor
MNAHAVPEGIDAAILDEAAAWLVQLRASDVSATDRQAWQQWHDRSPAHAQAWMRAERLLGRLGDLPGELARPVLGRNHDAMRRQMLGKLAVMLSVAPAAWTAWRYGPEWTADYRTGTGEQRSLTLVDGSEVVLNTSTALDIRFDAQQRRLHLLRGEILIDTAKDSYTPARPFLVESAQGMMRALGTRFSVQQLDGRTRLTVLEGAVEIQLRDTMSLALIVRASESAEFTRSHIDELRPATDASVAWSRGMLIADAMPLGDLVAELSRYRTGVMRCDPRVAGIVVSGAFPISNIERSLSMLQTTYPVKVAYATRFWVSISPG